MANPLPEAEQMDPALHDRVLADALDAAEAGGVAGKDVTPFVLARFHERTGGGEPARQHPPGAGERGAGRAHRGGPRDVSGGPVVVVGDVMTDVLAAFDGPLRPGGRHARPPSRCARAARRQHRRVAGAPARADASSWAAWATTPSGATPRAPCARPGSRRGWRSGAAATGTVIVLVDAAGERTMLPDSGANAELAPSTSPATSSSRAGTCTSRATPCCGPRPGRRRSPPWPPRGRRA